MTPISRELRGEFRLPLCPELFRSKLRHYRRLTKESDERMQQYPGIREAAVEKIYALENVKSELEDMND